ncbi:RILP-like protein 2 [Protopterus annectens]|uniref:RILP-like protein 2 n=1 Tax=Protopterus annectens TaxID=7888 RepID=UPI001CFBD2A2|nr:RILP-like protein 2 [Protopterus annectens]
MDHSTDDSGPESAFERDPFELTVEDVYDISSVIGRDLLKVTSRSITNSEVTELQFRIVRVLEMFETLVNKFNLTVEELRMERDNLKAEVERLLKEGPNGSGGVSGSGTDKMMIDMRDPNRPRFTLQELREVLQERNQLKAQLLVVQEELQCYKSGIIPTAEQQVVEIETEPAVPTIPSTAETNRNNENIPIIKRLFSYRQGKQT